MEGGFGGRDWASSLSVLGEDTRTQSPLVGLGGGDSVQPPLEGLGGGWGEGCLTASLFAIAAALLQDGMVLCGTDGLWNGIKV